MRIGIEAQRIFRKKKGGMDVVALEIIKSLQKIDKENEYIIYARKGEDTVNAIEETDNFKIKYIKGFSYIDWEQISLPMQVVKDKLDILHCTSNTSPLFCSTPVITTIHDIIYLEKNPWPSNANLYQRLGNYYRSIIVPQIVKRTKQVITVSDFEKMNMRDFFKLDEALVNVVPNGVNPVFRKIEEDVFLNSVKIKYHLEKKFILFMGNTDPRKNIKNLLESYSILVSRNSSAPDLAITNISANYLRQLLTVLGLRYLESKIILTGYVDFADLPAMYNLAEFFIYPSLREGFGLPIVESMACGTAVITSNCSSMPEIAGEAALLTDPCNPENMAYAMNAYLLNPSLKEEKIRLGNERYKRFTWESSANQLLNIYYYFLKNRFTEKQNVLTENSN